MASYARVKISHNDIFRSLLNVPRWASASRLFVEHHVNNLDSLIRNNYYSIMTRVVNSVNPIVSSLVNSDVRIHSCMWRRWGLALGRDLVDSF